MMKKPNNDKVCSGVRSLYFILVIQKQNVFLARVANVPTSLLHSATIYMRIKEKSNFQTSLMLAS